MSVMPTEYADRESWFANGHAPSVTCTRSIGEILVQDGVLAVAEVEHILVLQEKKIGLRFGEAALKLGLVKAKDVERALALQFAHLPFDAGDTKLSRELVVAHRPASAQVEQLRDQRSLLVQHWFGAQRTLAIVGPYAADGRSYFAANLAMLFSQLGRETLLIDADMRQPRQHELFGVPNRVGLSLLLAGRMRPGQAVQHVAAVKTFSLMTSGPVPPNPLELLDRGGLAEALKELSQVFSVIIVDTPPGSRFGDAHVIAHHCGGALMLLRRHRTRLSDAKSFAERLRRAQVQVIGTVLNRF
ncbi:MAG: polysaccharide biosynthesis tyrosine autokinase [Gammaproteobacteria bacterium]|nr:polysaccharide biosynthesis tyrosine autokinase [Gammaproteobacteria bacterium]